MAPLPAASMCGTTARVSMKGAVRLMRSTRSHSSSVTSSGAVIASMIPALLTSTSMPSYSAMVRSTMRSTTAWSLTSPVTASRRRARGDDLGHDCVRALGDKVDHDDTGALVREPQCGSSPDTRPCAGDDDSRIREPCRQWHVTLRRGVAAVALRGPER